MSDFKALEDIVPSTKEGKLLIPAIVRAFSDFQESLTQMFESFKTDLMKMVEEKNEEVIKLKSKVSTLEKHIYKLEERIEENDAYERRDTIIVSGRKIPPSSTSEHTSSLVCNLLKEELNYNLQPNDISVCHRLGSTSQSQKPDRRAIILKLCRRDIKLDLVSSARKKKPDGFFVNECLTPSQQTISYVLRAAKRQFPQIVSGSTTYDGKNFAWVKSKNPQAAAAKDKRIKLCSRRSLVRSISVSH